MKNLQTNYYNIGRDSKPYQDPIKAKNPPLWQAIEILRRLARNLDRSFPIITEDEHHAQVTLFNAEFYLRQQGYGNKAYLYGQSRHKWDMKNTAEG